MRRGYENIDSRNTGDDRNIADPFAAEIQQHAGQKDQRKAGKSSFFPALRARADKGREAADRDKREQPQAEYQGNEGAERDAEIGLGENIRVLYRRAESALAETANETYPLAQIHEREYRRNLKQDYQVFPDKNEASAAERRMKQLFCAGALFKGENRSGAEYDKRGGNYRIPPVYADGGFADGFIKPRLVEQPWFVAALISQSFPPFHLRFEL